MYKVDLHTHSIDSPDGGLDLRHYGAALEQGRLEYIAITDHDRIDAAQHIQRELGDCIIVGEEITTEDGEIIGLYLRKRVPSGLSLKRAVQAIRRQNGLVYVPHPFETVRKGLSLDALHSIAGLVDIIEIRNGRAVFQNQSEDALHWAAMHGVAGAASSDAHGLHGWGKTYSRLNEAPTRETLVRLLERATYATDTVGIRGLLYPKFNRVRKKFL
jgi:predicted metal-dependent phosphoesterase TrpH